jgi:D-3-phosphoglycerate dehydrogenase
MKILANDGIDDIGKEMLEKAGFTVDTNKIEQGDLASKISNYDVIIVRSATKVNADIMDAGGLKLIARAGVGLDNIDLKHAGQLNIPVVNTPNASSKSVAELVYTHIFSLVRFAQITNRIMPVEGDTKFKELKSMASKGTELSGKCIGIIGFGRIGQEVAKIAIGLGMKVMIYDYKERTFDVTITLHADYAINNFKVSLKGHKMETVMAQSDFISVHTPGSAEVIGAEQIALMKDDAILVNCARGGVVNEKALLAALNNKKLRGAGIDVFESEPPVFTDILKPDNVSLTPHIGASTAEGQTRVGIELAERIISILK